MAVLERGGNAFDAAVAAGFTLQVVEPHLNGPGGDLPAVFWPASRGEPLVLCAQGVAPGRGDDRARSRARPRARCPGPGCSPRASRARSAAGCCCSRSSERGGSRTCSRSRSATPSTAIPSSPGSPRSIERVEPLLREWPGSAELYLPAPRAGHDVPQPAARGDVDAAARRGARRLARGGDRARARASSTTASSQRRSTASRARTAAS